MSGIVVDGESIDFTSGRALIRSLSDVIQNGTYELHTEHDSPMEFFNSMIKRSAE